MKVCFVPHFETGNQFRYDSSYFFDDSMLTIELSIIDFFSKLINYDLVIKALNGTIYSEIFRDFIKKEKYQNIHYEDGNLLEVLEKCDLAIIDFPSSSIMEANKANIPTLVLSYSELCIRKNALEQYKNIEIFQYNNQQEILENISEFINENS